MRSVQAKKPKIHEILLPSTERLLQYIDSLRQRNLQTYDYLAKGNGEYHMDVIEKLVRDNTIRIGEDGQIYLLENFYTYPKIWKQYRKFSGLYYADIQDLLNELSLHFFARVLGYRGTKSMKETIGKIEKMLVR